MKYEMNEMIECTRKYREYLLNDPYRPAFHFAVPDDNGTPGDPNGAFFADGRYHLMYLYHNVADDAYHWGHISSTDLLHWRHHPDALLSDKGDRGCYSGGAFLDDDGTAYLTFWKFAALDENEDRSGIAVAYSKPPYDKWERITPIAVNATEWGILDMEVEGIVKHIACADPGNIWKEGDCYYLQTGNLPVLKKYGQGEDALDEYKGDYTDLFRSKDLKNWTFAHRFYQNPRLDEDYPAETEDDMCPSLFRLSNKKSGGKLIDKWLQIFLAHTRGAQYYIGSLKDEHFYPEQHGRFSWNDKACFAPEALVDDKNRQIVWFWLKGHTKDEFERCGWSGVFSFPRVVWYEDGFLHMAPAEELDLLQYNEQSFSLGKVDAPMALDVKNGELLRIKAKIVMGDATKAGFSVRCSSDNSEHTDIYVDRKSGKLVLDTTISGAVNWKKKEEAPFVLDEGEPIKLDIFVDKSIVEVYVNERQAICRKIYPVNPTDAVHVNVISDGADFGEVHAWEMSPTNPY